MLLQTLGRRVGGSSKNENSSRRVKFCAKYLCVKLKSFYVAKPLLFIEIEYALGRDVESMSWITRSSFDDKPKLFFR